MLPQRQSQSVKGRSLDPAGIRRPSNTRRDAQAFALNQRQSDTSPIVDLASDTVLDPSQSDRLLSCSGTHTHTLPDAVVGLRFYFLNTGSGVITISGTINGNASGYKLVNPYQYVEIAADGSTWLVTSNN